MKINKVDLFRKYLDLLMVEYVDPCTGEHVCHSMSPTTTLVPINGVPCPVAYPVIYNATSYSTEALLLGAVQTTYTGFTITYNNITCEFSFTGTSIPPTTIELSTVVPPSTIVPISGVSCPVTYPVNYNGNSYASESALLSAVQGVYPTFTITYNNMSCEFTFVGNGTTPTNIVLSAPVASCNPVTNLQLVNVGTTTIDLMWDIPTPTPNDYRVRVYDGATLVQTQITTNSNITISGLNPLTTYDVRVQSRCGSANTNNSINTTLSVTTGDPCNPPINPATIPIVDVYVDPLGDEYITIAAMPTDRRFGLGYPFEVYKNGSLIATYNTNVNDCLDQYVVNIGTNNPGDCFYITWSTLTSTSYCIP